MLVLVERDGRHLVNLESKPSDSGPVESLLWRPVGELVRAPEGREVLEHAALHRQLVEVAAGGDEEVVWLDSTFLDEMGGKMVQGKDLRVQQRAGPLLSLGAGHDFNSRFERMWSKQSVTMILGGRK